jgi:hypothetical protein
MPALAEDAGTSLDYSPAHFHYEPPADGAKDEKAEPRRHGSFGDKGSHWLTFGAGAADNFTDSVDMNLHIAWSTFLVKDVELALEGAGWYFNQPGDNTGGVSGSVVFRWHFYNDDNWTVFADAGIGLLGAFDDVPDGGTSFDFLPRAGGGVTKRLFEGEDTRLQVGVRWHHISNARINGDDNNPSRDGAMLYAGLIIPF